MEDERTTKSAENVSMNANRVSEQKSYTALSTKAKEQGKEPSAIESEIYPSHKSHDLCSVYFALRGLKGGGLIGKTFVYKHEQTFQCQR